MRININRGKPLIDDPHARRLSAIGVDETAFLRPPDTPGDVCDRHRRPHPRPARPAAGRRRGPVRRGAGRLAHDRDDAVAGADRDRLARPVPRLRHRARHQLPNVVRVLDPFHVMKLGLTGSTRFAAASSRTPSGTAVIAATRSTGPAASCAAAPTGSPSGPGSLRAGLVAGDPCGEVTAAWIIAQDLMAAYQPRPTPAPRSSHHRRP